MDKHFLQILLIILISTIIGLMDKVKFHWEQTWFSTILKPDWFAKWLNPHSIIPTKSRILAFLFKYALAGIGDFWHLLKFLMLQTVFYLVWVSYHESRLIVWLVLCNIAYGVIFEVVYQGLFNKKEGEKK